MFIFISKVIFIFISKKNMFIVEENRAEQMAGQTF